MQFKRMLYWLWPPYEVQQAEQEIVASRGEADAERRWQTLLERGWQSLPEYADYDEIEKLAKALEDSESKRKETLESKAASFVSNISLALGITSTIIALFIDSQMSRALTAMIGIAYVVAVVYFLAAASCSTKARNVSAFATLSADSLLESFRNAEWGRKSRIVSTIARVKWNEESLIFKANNLSAAESAFLRGIFLVAFVVALIILSKLLTTVGQGQPTPFKSPLGP